MVLLIFLTTFAIHARAQSKASLTFEDQAVLGVNKKTYFLSELNHTLASFKILKCFPSHFLQNYLNINLKDFGKFQALEGASIRSARSKYRLNRLILYVKLEQFALGKSIYQAYKKYYKNRTCNYIFNKRNQKLMFLELYLSDRFSSLGSSSIISFKNSMISMINVKLFD